MLIECKGIIILPLSFCNWIEEKPKRNECEKTNGPTKNEANELPLSVFILHLCECVQKCICQLTENGKTEDTKETDQRRSVAAADCELSSNNEWTKRDSVVGDNDSNEHDDRVLPIKLLRRNHERI